MGVDAALGWHADFPHPRNLELSPLSISGSAMSCHGSLDQFPQATPPAINANVIHKQALEPRQLDVDRRHSGCGHRRSQSRRDERRTVPAQVN
jgi:hypothetical protein